MDCMKNYGLFRLILHSDQNKYVIFITIITQKLTNYAAYCSIRSCVLDKAEQIKRVLLLYSNHIIKFLIRLISYIENTHMYI